LKGLSVRPKAWWFIITFFTGFVLAMFANELALHRREQELHIRAPNLHFLNGASLDRLKNGAAVPFDFHLSLAVDSSSNLYDRAVERFVISYDLWEEKYSVTKLWGSSSMRGSSRRGMRERRSVSHLSATAAESWCIDNIAVSTSGLDPNRRMWVRLEVRSSDPRDMPPIIGESGISISRLIELFSHPPRSGQQRWTLQTGPIRLADLGSLVGSRT
jgi:hypothetical protein